MSVARVLALGEESLNEIRAEHGLGPRGHETGDPPTDEQLAAYVEALEAAVVAHAGARAAW